jgi:hypothetical protein
VKAGKGDFMTIKPKSEKVPKKMQSTYNTIIALTDEFCQEHLNEEYAQLARQLTAALCRKRPSPLSRGRPNSWACGIIYALGFVNFLFDKNNDPYLSAAELGEGFGVSKSTGANKSKEIRDLMDMVQFDPNWCLPSLMDENPLVWMIMVDGFVMDARSAPLSIQEVAYEKGLIPYIPGRPGSDRSKKGKKDGVAGKDSLYRLEAFLTSGPVTEEFVKHNPVVSRTIEIRGDQTLAELHQILFKAFDREEEHLYEFQFKGKGPADPQAERYVSPLAVGHGEEIEVDGLSTETKIGSLDLEEGEPFGYWFDFGDDWWHQINVVAIREEMPAGNYPRIIERVGESPPQYVDFD